MTPIPPQLKVGEVSPELRLYFDYAISKEIGRNTSLHTSDRLNNNWTEVASDLHVFFFKKPIRSFDKRRSSVSESLGNAILQLSIGNLFDLVEFFVTHSGCTTLFKHELERAFIDARAAYRLFDGQIIAIGTEEQGAAVERAIKETAASGEVAARRHLISSGAALKDGNWSDSVRESIHAVEAMARKIDPSAHTLAPALKALEKKGYIHGSLKAGFEKLYGYTNDERGIRHALSDEESRVDEVDAIFMLGACASFVSYLIAKEKI
jgi:hypothetical protein